MSYTGGYCIFAVEMFFKTSESVIVKQRAFYAHFMLCQNDHVLDRKLILLWIENSIQKSIIHRVH